MKKSVIIILSILIAASTGLGVTGYIASSDGEESPVNTPQTYDITYKFYLDDEEVSAMPTNNRPTDGTTNGTEGETQDGQTSENEEYINQYTFKNYTCTNNVQGAWDNEAWTFTPVETANATCVLYFESNFLSVDVKTNNAEVNELDALKDRKVKRGEEITYSITPTEGYKYEKVECTNNAKGTWDEENKKLTVSEVTKNTTCEISFIIDEYTVTFSVNHGTLTETEKSAKYGDKITTKITPADEYVYNKVTCTNNQVATYDTETNTLTIDKLTNKTLCTVDFVANEYTVTLKVINGTPAEEKKTIKNGSNAAFTISNNPNYIVSNDAEISCTNEQKGRIENNLFQVTGVTNNTVCTVTLKEATTQAE